MVHLLVGDDRGRVAQRITEICDVFVSAHPYATIHHLSGDDSGEELSAALDAAVRSTGLFTPNAVIVLRGLCALSMMQQKKAVHSIEYCAADNSPLTCIVVEESITKKTPLSNFLREDQRVVREEFPILTGVALRRWVEDRVYAIAPGTTIDRDALVRLCAVLDGDGHRQPLVDAVALLVVDRDKHITRSDVDTVYGIVSSDTENVFRIADALQEGNSAQALTMLEGQLVHGGSPLALVGVYAYHLRTLAMVAAFLASGGQKDEVAQALDLKPFIAQKMVRAAQRMTLQKIRSVLLLITRVERAIKTGSSGAFVLERFVLAACR